ncbi:hypothetical protein CR513_15663, partial [Mucuna pruriens]
MVVTCKDWHDMLPYALHEYHTLVRTSKGQPSTHWCMARKIKNAFNKKVRPCRFKEGNLVLRKIVLNAKDPKGKWNPNYKGPTWSNAPSLEEL